MLQEGASSSGGICFGGLYSIGEGLVADRHHDHEMVTLFFLVGVLVCIYRFISMDLQVKIALAAVGACLADGSLRRSASHTRKRRRLWPYEASATPFSLSRTFDVFQSYR